MKKLIMKIEYENEHKKTHESIWPQAAGEADPRKHYIYPLWFWLYFQGDSCVYLKKKTNYKTTWRAFCSFYLLNRFDPRWTFSLRIIRLFPSAESLTFWIVFHTRSLSFLLPSRVSIASAISDCSCGAEITIISVEFTQK